MSSDKSEEEEHEAVSRQIVDYYRKYSLNKHLPKYFSGSSLSYMPPIVKEDDIMPRLQPTIVIDDTTSETLVQRQTEEPLLEDFPEPKVVSPTSSITSNRKLEWDNGADIGYSNYQSNTKLFKSHSLPILLVDKKKSDKSPTTKLSTQIVTVISYPSDDDNVDVKQIPSSSSSASYPPEAPIISSSSSVGTNVKPISTSSSSFSSTIAYLKSKIGTPDAKSTPKFPPRGQIYTDTPFVPRKQKDKKNRVINLCLTKPITVECFDKHKKRSSDKEIQTTFAEGLSNKCIQTSGSLERSTQERKSEPKPKENQSVILITYDSDSDKRICSSNAQTDADIASPCDSFEYYRQEKQTVASTDSSKDIPLLSQLITEKQSKSLIGDVDRSIGILQKLLKSKKYDPVTKKRYIKKIVEKIVDSKYSEDSTTSSELFVPKIEQKLKPPQVSKFTVKTFSDEFVPSDSSEKKTSVHSQQEEHSGGVTDRSRSTLEKQSISSSSYQSWKDDKTSSEKHLEEKQKGQGDHLVKFAMKERQHQISWINDEISHLTQLKGLLEKKIQTTTTCYMVSQHSDKSGTNSSTSKSRDSHRNYVIQTELSSSGSASGVPKNYNLYEKTGKERYCVSEMSKYGGSSGDKKVVGDIEVLCDDKTTNIKVKTKPCEVKAETFRPKPPALIGFGKYDTFPKSKAEEKSWPSGKSQQSRRPEYGSYTFEVPYKCNIADKVREIVKKYTKPSVEKFSKCECICTCPKSSEDTDLFCAVCCKCRIPSNKDSQETGKKEETAICQVKPCGCCQRQIETTVCTKDSSCCCWICKKSTKNKVEQIQTTICTKDTKCCCQRCQDFDSKKEKTGNVKCQAQVCSCDEQVQTTTCTRDANCCCRRCQNLNKKKNVGNVKCQTQVCTCDEKIQTTICTGDPRCCCRRCQNLGNKKHDVGNAKCQAQVCTCDEKIQTNICTGDPKCCCRRCQDLAKKKENVDNAKCQTRVCTCDEKIQTTICTGGPGCCCWRCQNLGNKKQDVENAKCQTQVCSCDEKIQTNICTGDPKCCCRRCEDLAKKKENVDNAKCQTQVCTCDEKIQTTICTGDPRCCCWRCRNLGNKKQDVENAKCQTQVCSCDEKIQTNICTGDPKCCCRRCQDLAKKKKKQGNAKCQTRVCTCDEKIQTTVCTGGPGCCCWRCQNLSNKKEDVNCQTRVCACDEQVQTVCSGDPRCCCRRCRDLAGKKENVENAKCQTQLCTCDEANQTACTGDPNCCCPGCQASNNKKKNSEDAKCQTKICQCEEKVQTCVCTKDAICGCRDSNQKKTGEVKCQTEVCDCDQKTQTNVCTKDESCTCCTCCQCDQTPGKKGNPDSCESLCSSSSSYSYSDSDSCISGSLKSCRCCKRKNLSQKYLCQLKQKLCDQTYPLCRPCYRQNVIGTYPVNWYSNPSHVCNCYSVVQTTTLNEIQKTITELQVCEEFCTCANGGTGGGNSDYCKYCQRRLDKTSQNKNCIAYLLTFEDESFKKEKKAKKPRLEEIKVKIPVARRKKHKEKENKRKKQSYDSEEASSSGVRKRKTATLQDYLSQNRPDFVQYAERRRQTVNDSRTQREEMSDYNKLRFLQKCQEQSDRRANRLFSAKEMKEINERNYKKLPEVQKKLNDNRDKQLRQASRLMAHTFNKKLRENVLKGNRDLPINVKVVTL